MKETILSKTHYGLKIYSQILRLYYPDETVMRLVGRDCGLCRNPFNSNKETLHIWIHKTDPTNALSAEYALHEDTENAILAGDAFDFAALHYKQQGAELLQTLNKALNLRIGEQWSFYPIRSTSPVIERSRNAPTSPIFPVKCPNSPAAVIANGVKQSSNNNKFLNNPQDCLCITPNEAKRLGDKETSKSPQTPPSKGAGGCLFSFYKAPITNTTPHKKVNLLQVYNAIKGDYYRDKTRKLQAIPDVGQVRKFKATYFDYCTFSGTFTTRNDKALLKHSGLLCIDFDHLPNPSELKSRLLADEYFETLLLFRSPSGNGLKWIIPIDTAGTGVLHTLHADYFNAVSNYIKATYNIEIDKSGRDISRACFLPHDPQAYLNPKFA